MAQRRLLGACSAYRRVSAGSPHCRPPTWAASVDPPAVCNQTRRFLATRAVGSDTVNSCQKMLATFSVDHLEIKPRMGPKTALPPIEKIGFGQVYSDLMCVADWDDQHGWYRPVIKQLENLSLHPGCTALHYAIISFEGIKAFRSSDGRVLLFRPHDHARRFVDSSERVALPPLDVQAFVEMLRKYARLEADYIVPERGYSLYLRPILFSTYTTLGVYPARSAKMVVMGCPSGAYFAPGMKMFVETQYVRSWPGGAGSVKAACNYAPTIQPCKQRLLEGYNQLLWTMPEGDDVLWTEGGAMSLFVLWVNESGDLELATPLLERQLILPGIIRDTVLQLTREKYHHISVTERRILMKKDFIPAFRSGRVRELFCTGTGAIVVSVGQLVFQGEEFNIPVKETSFADQIKDSILDIQMGLVPGHPFVVEC